MRQQLHSKAPSGRRTNVLAGFSWDERRLHYQVEGPFSVMPTIRVLPSRALDEIEK